MTDPCYTKNLRREKGAQKVRGCETRSSKRNGEEKEQEIKKGKFETRKNKERNDKF
jgi:hypothetical protein